MAGSLEKLLDSATKVMHAEFLTGIFNKPVTMDKTLSAAEKLEKVLEFCANKEVFLKVK